MMLKFVRPYPATATVRAPAVGQLNRGQARTPRTQREIDTLVSMAVGMVTVMLLLTETTVGFVRAYSPRLELRHFHQPRYQAL